MGCEKDEKNTYSKNIIGHWDGFKRNYSYSIQSNQSQLMVNPYERGIGVVEVSGAETASLTYMYIYSANGVLQISMAKNVFDIPSEESNYILNIYDYGYFGSFSQLTVTSSDYSTLYEGELEYTVNSIINGNGEVTIQSGALYHSSTNDSVMITGTLAPIQVAVNAGTVYEIGNVDWDFTNYLTNLFIDGNKTFKKTIRTLDGEVLIDSGTWDATEKELTFYYANRTQQFTFNVTNSNLDLIYINDLCIQAPDDCLPQYEWMYGMVGGSLENVVLKETTFFNKSSN